MRAYRTGSPASIGIVIQPAAARVFYITPFFIARSPLAQLDFPMCADINFGMFDLLADCPAAAPWLAWIGRGNCQMVVADVLPLKTLADVRDLINKHLLAEGRATLGAMSPSGAQKQLTAPIPLASQICAYGRSATRRSAPTRHKPDRC